MSRVSSIHNDTSRSILFEHFHKRSGTQVCKSLQQSISITTQEGLPVPLKQNCNTPFSGPNVKPGHHLQTCQNLQPYSFKTNFVAVEVPFREIMPCYSFRTFAIMRDPVTRLLSHMRAHRYTPERI
mmetsp:Transcript_16038/g.28971  ORF Transcript_16038/g.28971 Transcript_16038/m.28971 type:complete len:126 (+) Transcript_16038:180-557(+)